MNRILQVFCALFSSFIIGYAIPNEFSLFGSPLAGLLGLIPLYIAVSRAKSYKETFYLMGLQAFAIHLISSFWLAYFRDFAIFTLGISGLATAVFAAVFGHFMYVPFAQRTRQQRLAEYGGHDSWSLPLRVLWFAAIYTLWEWIKSIGFLGYPWGTISMSVIGTPILMQIADITGTYGITFIFAFFAAVCGEGILLIGGLIRAQNAEAVFSAFKHTATACIAVMILSFAYGVYEYAKPRIPEKLLNTVIVQQNSDPWMSNDDSLNVNLSEHLSEEKINEFKKEGKEPELVIWSEDVLRYSFPGAQNYYRENPQPEPLCSFIKRMGVPFIIGAPYTINRKKRQYSNSAILFDSNGTYRGQFGKMHLVPFAEVIPGSDLKWVQDTMQTLVGFSSGWTPGNYFTLFELPAHRNPKAPEPVTKIISLVNPSIHEDTSPVSVLVSTPICFEDAFPDICGPLFKAGSEVFFNMTDDSWSRTKSAEYQHYAVAAFRAIEYRTTLVRSTNAGYSVVLTPAGKKVSDLPLFKADSLAVTVPIYKRQITLYARFGNWFPKLLLILVCIYILSVQYKMDIELKKLKKLNCKPVDV